MNMKQEFPNFQQSKINNDTRDVVEHIELKGTNLEMLSEEELRSIASLEVIPGSNIWVVDKKIEDLVEFRNVMEKNKGIIGDKWSLYDGYAKKYEEILNARRILKDKETSNGQVVH